MAAIDHHAGVVLGQVDVDGKTNEIPMFSQLCDQIPDLEAVVVTADGMHCHKAHADYLVLQRGAQARGFATASRRSTHIAWGAGLSVPVVGVP
jgi:predicted transposase YbfD/YdcC